MLFRLVILALVFATILATASGYLFRRLVRAFTLRERARRALGGVLGLSAVLAVGVRALGGVPLRLLTPVEITAFTIMLGAVFTALLLAAIDLAIFLAGLPARARRHLASAPSASPIAPPLTPALAPSTAPSIAPPVPAAADVSRREFLARATATSAIFVGVGTSAYGALVGRHDYVIEDVPVRIPGLSRRLDGLTIVQLSDLHIGTFVGEAELRAAEDLVRRARPDLLILTGDLIDNDRRHADALARFVRRLAALPRHGLFAIPGNHDYYTGLDVVRAAVTGGGGRMLINDGLVVGDAGASFALLGVDDVFGPRSDPRSAGPDLDRALAAVPADLPRVLLCHNPQFFPNAAGKVALQLSGHTHGGQINLGVPSARLVLGHSFIAGSYRLRDTTLYVNRGFGTAGPPARIGASPEVSRIILTA